MIGMRSFVNIRLPNRRQLWRKYDQSPRITTMAVRANTCRLVQSPEHGHRFSREGQALSREYRYRSSESWMQVREYAD